MLKRLSLVVAVAVLFAGCAKMDKGGQGFVVPISMDTINMNVKKNFPMDKKIGEGMFGGVVTLLDPEVAGKSGSDELAIGSNFSFKTNLLPTVIKGAVSLASGIRYEKETKSLYLDKPEVQEIKLGNTALSKYISKEQREQITDLLVDALKKEKIHTLDKNDYKTGFVKAVRVNNGKVEAVVGF